MSAIVRDAMRRAGMKVDDAEKAQDVALSNGERIELGVQSNNMAPVLKKKLFQQLDNAVKNGHMDFVKMRPAEIADDITQYSSDFEEIEPEMLIPAIKQWQSMRAPGLK